MNKYYSTILLFLFVANLLSCQVENSEKEKAEFVLESELRVDVIGNPIILDGMSSGELLAINTTSDGLSVLHILDSKSGEVLKTINQQGEGPSDYNVIWNACFGRNGSIWVWARNGLFNYSSQGEFIKKLKLDFLKEDYAFFNIDAKKILTYNKDNTEHIILATKEYSYLEDSFDKYIMGGNLLSLNTSTLEYNFFAPYSKNSIYTSKRNLPFVQTLPFLAIDIKRNRLFVKYPLDYLIEVYNLTTFKKDRTYSLEKLEYIQFDPNPAFGNKKSSYNANYSIPQFDNIYFSENRILTSYYGYNNQIRTYVSFDINIEPVKFESLNQLPTQQYLNYIDNQGSLYFTMKTHMLFKREPEYSLFFKYKVTEK